MINHEIHLQQIPPTLPGQNYGLNVKADQMSGARVHRSRKELAMFCRLMLPTTIVVAELGVYRGDFARFLLSSFDLSALYLIDTNLELAAQDVTADHRAVLLSGKSWEVMEGIPDSSLDYLYVDGDHSYESVKKDVVMAHRKVRHGGIIQFNDYCTYSPTESLEYGVLNAVNAYLEGSDATIVGLSLDRSGYHDIAIQVRK